jgi:hypothetical protein
VEDEPPLPPPPKLAPEHETTKKLAKKRLAAKESQVARQRTTKTEDCGTSIDNSLQPDKGSTGIAPFTFWFSCAVYRRDDRKYIK